MLAATVLVAGCFAPRAEMQARTWRPAGAGGQSLGQLVAASPGISGVTWESFDGPDGRTEVRLAAEYAMARVGRNCPPPGAGSLPAARAFLILGLTVSPAGAVDFAFAEARAYAASGAYVSRPLDIGVMADLVARAAVLPCRCLVVPEGS
jgi:hypothetical protein